MKTGNREAFRRIIPDAPIVSDLNKNNTFIASFRDWNMLQDICRISRHKLA